VLVARNRQSLSKPGERLRRRIGTLNCPSRCRGVNELKRRGKPSACLYNKSETGESVSKKSIEHEDNGSGKSGNGKGSKNASVVSDLEKNVSKSVCGVESGMRRLSASENSAWHASLSG